MSEPLAGQTALVTGASGGIGEATGRALAEAGAAVALCARRRGRLEAIATDIEETGGTACAVVMDLLDEVSIREGVATVQDTQGPIDILVNNAGIGEWQFDDGDSIATARRIIDVNLTGLVTLTYLVLSAMRDRDHGHIVNLSSMSTESTGPLSIYNTSKAAVDTFTKGLTSEVRSEAVRVTLVQPGTVDTPMQTDDIRGSTWPLDATDVAELIMFAVTQPADVSVHNLQLIPTSPPE